MSCPHLVTLNIFTKYSIVFPIPSNISSSQNYFRRENRKTQIETAKIFYFSQVLLFLPKFWEQPRIKIQFISITLFMFSKFSKITIKKSFYPRLSSMCLFSWNFCWIHPTNALFVGHIPMRFHIKVQSFIFRCSSQFVLVLLHILDPWFA